MPPTSPEGLPLTILVSTLLGMIGAGLGAWLFGRALPVRHMLPFGSGLLLGIAVFLALPDALAEGPLLPVSLLCLSGCFVFSFVENLIHRIRPEPHQRFIGLVPLIAAISLHSILDGWNIAVAASAPGEGHMFAFLLGMGVHKFTGGFAVGAVFRASTPRRDWAIAWALACEAATLAGGILHMQASAHLPPEWTVWLLALSSGSFLYLAWHSFQTALRKNGLRPASIAAAIGAAAIGLLALFN